MSEFNIKEEFFKLKDSFAKTSIIKEVKKRQLLQKFFNEYEIQTENDEATLNKLFTDFCIFNEIKNKQELSYYLMRTKITKEELTNQLIYNNQINELKKRVITKQEILDFYLDKKYSMENVVFSIVRVNEKDLIEEIHQRISDGEDIEFFSRRYSQGDESKNNGLIGPVALSRINPIIKNKLLNLERGAISEAFQLNSETFAIVKLHWREGSEIDEKTEKKLRNILFEKWVEDQLNLEKLAV